MKKGILIIGHGSRYDYNKWIIEEQKARLEKKGFENVYIGFNEFTDPLVNDSLEKMVADGIDEVTAVPFLIASGRHANREIPLRLGIPYDSHFAEIVIREKKVTIIYEQPFGNDPALAAILSERIKEISNNRAKRWIMVVGQGSRQPYNKETVFFQANELEKMGYKNVVCAFSRLDEPSVEKVFDSLLTGGAEEIVILPLYISMGVCLNNEIPRKIGLMDGLKVDMFSYGGHSVVVKYASPIGNDPKLTEIVAKKILSRREQ